MQTSLWITTSLSGWLSVWQSLVAIVFQSVENSFFSPHTHCQGCASQVRRRTSENSSTYYELICTSPYPWASQFCLVQIDYKEWTVFFFKKHIFQRPFSAKWSSYPDYIMHVSTPYQKKLGEASPSKTFIV